MKIGIDVGGSHIGLGVVDKKGKLVFKTEKDYEIKKEDMSDVVINTIIELIEKAIKESKIDKKEIESIGIAIPGTVNKTDIVKTANLGINNLNITERLENILNVPIKLQNDAKCAAIAEKQFGSLKDYDDAIFLIVGTGIGGAVFLNGELLKAKNYSAFELGHMVVKENGEKCGCGRKGCFEAYGSIKRFKERIKKEFDLKSIDGREIEKFLLDNKDNEKLNSLIDTYIDDLSTGIINLVNIFEPEAISLGGSFAFYKDILLRQITKKNNRKK